MGGGGGGGVGLVSEVKQTLGSEGVTSEKETKLTN